MKSFDLGKKESGVTWTIEDIVDHKQVEQLLGEARVALAENRMAAILEKAISKKGLTPLETAILLYHGEKEPWLSKVLLAAKEVKEAIYGSRIVFFAPLYISNQCVNNCLYCAYRIDNEDIVRKTLTADEIAEEVRRLEDQGHKRLLLVEGEHGRIDNMLNALEVVYKTRKDKGEIRRANINIAPPTVEQFRQLKNAGIGTYQCFQETYHKETYKKMHPQGPKSDYDWRLTVMDRALQTGVDDVSTGVLLGLYDFHYDVTALILHGQYLDNRYRVGPHAVSVPRLRVAHGTPICEDESLNAQCYLVNDNQFKLIVAAIRLALPYTGIILSTRESAEMRQELMNAGVSQVSAGSHTEVGGYSKNGQEAGRQFEIEDTRSLEQVVNDVIASGNLSSFCTACYRSGRTGEVIMDLLKPGTIKNFCLPNAILTFKEYLIDYANEDTRQKGERIIEKQFPELLSEVEVETREKLKRIEQGERDLYF